jgi:hypothetical protein
MEWLAVIAAGAVGGCVGTLLPSGTDMPSPHVISLLLKGHSGWALAYHFLRNMVCGAAAGFILWALYSPAVSFTSAEIAPRAIGASLAIGIGGGWFLDRLLRKQHEALGSEATLEKLQAALDIMLDRAMPPSPAPPRPEENDDEASRSEPGADGETVA